MIEYLGWTATAVFVGSYLCRTSESLKRVQMMGALMWVIYGLLIQATPVVAANLLVFGAAGWASLRHAARTTAGVRPFRSRSHNRAEVP